MKRPKKTTLSKWDNNILCNGSIAERTGNGRGTARRARQTVRGRAQMMSTKFLGSWAPPPCPHLGPINITESTQSPLLLSNFGLPPSPLNADVI